jgi:lysine 2,3-aminomutase
VASNRRKAPAWRRELAAAITDPAALAALCPARGFDPADLDRVARRYPARVTPGYAALIDPGDPADPIARMVLPDPRELQSAPYLCADPLAEERDSPLPGVVHRYRDRVLLVLTGRCPATCRFCMRRRVVGRPLRGRGEAWLDAVRGYLADHPGVREVLLSGGDPLMRSDGDLAQVLAAIRSVPHVELVRVDTRAPVVLPSRITWPLVALLRRAAPLWVVAHFNHPRELTDEAVAACGRLVDAGIPVETQTVLLAGVNDDEAVLEDLCRGLLRARVRPYYLHQCDLVEGTEHFRTSLARGRALVRHLTGRVGGHGIPRYVVDAPGGHGKIPVAPETLVGRDETGTFLRAPDGAVVRYPDPLESDQSRGINSDEDVYRLGCSLGYDADST